MSQFKSAFTPKTIAVLLLSALIVSAGLNFYQHFFPIEISYVYQPGEVMILKEIDGGMGQMSVKLSSGWIVSPGYERNISVAMGVWAPFTGERHNNATFRVYERSSQNDTYPDEPIAEVFTTGGKEKDETHGHFSSGIMTVKVPETSGIYVDRIWIQIFDEQGNPYPSFYEFEYPIWVIEDIGIIPPNV